MTYCGRNAGVSAGVSLRDYMTPFRFDIITLFPTLFDAYMDASILKRAREHKLIEVVTHHLREFAAGKHRKVDDTPYGGGAGMVLMAEPILKAVRVVRRDKRCRVPEAKTKIVVLSAKGKQFNQKTAYMWEKRYRRIILVSGRYEGIDERVRLALKAEEISIGPYVLTDGDVAAMAIVSAVARLIPGVIKRASLAEESHGNLLVRREATGRGRGLEYPHYTRPEVFKWNGKAYRVPKVLLSGNHANISEWRRRHGGD